ncbi:MAG: hypothetical protein Q4A98_11335, partial [Comamonadaceae bacterium]|nr:hypothetical protein [Comamonadaceae bacterium]
LFVAPLAKTESLGCGVRRDPGHLLRLRTHGKTLNRLLQNMSFQKKNGGLKRGQPGNEPAYMKQAAGR